MVLPQVIETAVRKDRYVVLAALVTVIVGCWIYLLTGAGMGMYPHKMAMWVPEPMSSAMNMDPSTPGLGTASQSQMAAATPSMGDMIMTPASWTPSYALLMFAMWWLMMIAMMLPSASPMILLHAAVTRKAATANRGAGAGRGLRNPYRATSAFAAGYLAIWGSFSLLAVLAQWALERAELISSMMMTTSKLLGAALLLAAGVWQLTPLKNACLRHCRSPIGFVSSHWRPGVYGAFRMGVEHGVYCLGCCWFLMALLFYGGVMNLIWIIGLAVFVLAEKLLPHGVLVGRVTGVMFIGWGGWLVWDTL